MNNQVKSTLPQKELSLFRRVVKCYEQKQFKNGLKFSKQILTNPKFCEHGETLAMRGLILSCMGKRDESYEYVKRGIKNDIKSSICWHVYGLVQKSDRKYDEAMKCYLRALKVDKDNIQILRDLSLLQVQMRNYEGYLETRSQLFQLRPSQKASWLGYAVAQHLLENYDDAIKLLDEYMKVQQNIPSYNFEHSELLVYYISILLEAGKFNEAMTFMKENEMQIVDKVYYYETMGDLYLKINEREKAIETYRSLIDRNPDNEMYYQKLLDSMGLQTEDENLAVLDELCDKYNRAWMPLWIPLKLVGGAKFCRYADRYLKRSLKKGVWALFVQLKFLYSDAEKIKILEDLYESYKKSILQYQTLDGPEGDIEPPTTEIYVNYLLAQHYGYLGRTDDALELVNNQLNHTPTLIEFYTLKGRIYYDAGNVLYASKCLDEAQSMDTADRFINCVCTKYMIEANRFRDAENMAAKFTREGMRSLDNLNEMQCMWFLNTMSRSYQKLHKYGDALQKCHEVNKHFTNVLDDQFDFHSYCLRKTTLRAYVDLLRTEDKLKEHNFFFETAKTAIEIYLHITDHPVSPEDNADDLDMANLSISEAKKLKNKQRRQKKKAEFETMKKQIEQEKRDQLQKSKNNDKEENEIVEEKVDGSRLVQTTTPLDDAVKFLIPLLNLSYTRLETHCLAFNVYEKKNKPLLMLRSIRNGLKVKGSLDNPVFHECLLRFILKFNAFKSEVNDVLLTVINSVMEELPYGSEIVNKSQTLNDEFLERSPNSLLHNFYYWHINNLIQNRVTKDAFTSTEVIKGKSENWQDCESVLLKLESDYDINNSDQVFQALKSRFHNQYPLCTAFMSAEQLSANQNESVIVNAIHYSGGSTSALPSKNDEDGAMINGCGENCA